MPCCHCASFRNLCKHTYVENTLGVKLPQRITVFHGGFQNLLHTCSKIQKIKSFTGNISKGIRQFWVVKQWVQCAHLRLTTHNEWSAQKPSSWGCQMAKSQQISTSGIRTLSQAIFQTQNYSDRERNIDNKTDIWLS